jgi:putative SOS response-associated peptidase YedK
MREARKVLEKKTCAPLIQKHKTCLVLAEGFYEWDGKSGKSIPYRFILKEREVFAFAGLWSQWKRKDGTQVYRSFTIMTTEANKEANKVVGKVHDPKFRMPVILDKYSETSLITIETTVERFEHLQNQTPFLLKTRRRLNVKDTSYSNQ